MANIVLQQAGSRGTSVAKVTDTTKGATFASSSFQVGGFTTATIAIITSVATGTTPTLDIAVQKLLPDGTTWHAIAQFSQITGAATTVMELMSGGSGASAGTGGIVAATATSLSAGTIHDVPFGGVWRLNYVFGGSTPIFTIVTAIEMA